MVALAAGCSDPCEGPLCRTDLTDASPGSSFDVEQTFSLRGGELVEAWMKLGSGSELEAEFDASPRGVTWDVHSHPGNDPDEVTQHDAGFDASKVLSFVTPSGGDYFLLFENRADAELVLTIRIRLPEQDQFIQWL